MHCNFHPVTTEYEDLNHQLNIYLCIKKSQLNYILILPNNDYGVKKILSFYNKIENLAPATIYEVEYYLVYLRTASLLFRNSLEYYWTPYFGVKLSTLELGRIIALNLKQYTLW